MSDLENKARLARAHSEAAMAGKPQSIDAAQAEYMGAFSEEAISAVDALSSIHDEEITHG